MIKRVALSPGTSIFDYLFLDYRFLTDGNGNVIILLFMKLARCTKHRLMADQSISTKSPTRLSPDDLVIKALPLLLRNTWNSHALSRFGYSSPSGQTIPCTSCGFYYHYGMRNIVFLQFISANKQFCTFPHIVPALSGNRVLCYLGEGRDGG
jgi:hypothetical protein